MARDDEFNQLPTFDLEPPPSLPSSLGEEGHSRHQHQARPAQPTAEPVTTAQPVPAPQPVTAPQPAAAPHPASADAGTVPTPPFAPPAIPSVPAMPTAPSRPQPGGFGPVGAPAKGGNPVLAITSAVMLVAAVVLTVLMSSLVLPMAVGFVAFGMAALSFLPGQTMRALGGAVLACALVLGGVQVVMIISRAIDDAGQDSVIIEPDRLTEEGDGEFVVGTDMEPGVYRAEGPSGDSYEPCEWTLVTDEDDPLGSNWEYTYAGRPVVELQEGQTFTTAGCGTWSPLAASALTEVADDAATTLTDGVWAAGLDLEPGVYRATTPVVSDDDFGTCRIRVYTDATWSFESMRTDEFLDAGRPLVQINLGDVAAIFGCGAMEKVDWKALEPTGTPPTTFEDGIWLVGVDIAPGKYKTVMRVDPEGYGCFVSTYDTPELAVDGQATLEMFTDNFGSLVAEDGWILVTSGCGPWKADARP